MSTQGKRSLWPVTVRGSTWDHFTDRRKRFKRIEDGAGDIERAMLKAVLAQPCPGDYVGTEIIAVTPLGQVCKRFFSRHDDGAYILVCEPTDVF